MVVQPHHGPTRAARLRTAACLPQPQEPTKAALLAFESGAAPAPPRAAACILHTPPARGAIEATVSLPDGEVRRAAV